MRLLPDDERGVAVVAVRRLTSEEAALAEVHVHPDLTALEELTLGDDLVLATGSEVWFDHSADPCALTGPPGWLGPVVAAGDVAVLRWDGTRLHVTCGPDEPAFDEVATARLQRLLVAAFEADQLDLDDDELDDEQAAEDIEFSGTAQLVVTVAEDHPGVFATLVPPLSEVLAGAGLEVHDEMVGRPGTQWDVLEALEEVISRIGVRRSGHVRSPRAFAAVHALLDAFEDGVESVDDARRLASLFAVEPGVAPAVVEEMVARDDLLSRAEHFVGQLFEAARGSTARAGAAWMQAALAQERGDVAAQERWLSRSLDADATYLPALLDASWCASDRGDASRAASLLAAAGVRDDNSWYRRLSGFARPGPNSAGRNDACPCGSGRKYKACCARTNGWPLAARAPWLYDKAAAYLDRSSTELESDELFDEDDDIDFALHLDLALFEEGILAEFIERRGPLLPPDERALAASWVGTRRGVYEVTELRPGEGMTVEDVTTGESTTLIERLGSRSLRLHLLVSLRLLDAGDGSLAIFGPVVEVGPGTEHVLAALLRDGSAADIARSWLDSQRPPAMRTKDGEDLAIARAVYAIDVPEEAERVASLDPGVGSISVSGGRVEVQALAASSLADLEAVVAEAAPGARLVDRVVLPLTAELVSRLRARPGDEAPDDDGDESPEAVEALAAFVREREERWPDEPLPALGGRTAREACADEEGRRDVRRLLASFRVGGPGTMDPDRLRAMLGL